MQCRVWLQLAVLWLLLKVEALREFRPWSRRTECEKAQDPNYPFALVKYPGQVSETKARVNSNLQDFRHRCQVRGGLSKCNICEEIICDSEKNNTCFLQLQGVAPDKMAGNLPTVTDTAWAVGGKHRKDFGGKSVSHFCVFTSGNGYTTSNVRTDCTNPKSTSFDGCQMRCFGYFGWLFTPCTETQIRTATCTTAKQAIYQSAPNATIVDLYPGMGRWKDDGQVDIWTYPRNCSELSSQFGVQCTFSGNTRSYNPQGFTFTLSGSGKGGLKDGSATVAQFQAPQDLAVDRNGLIYVADTMNHAIRLVWEDGSVSTLAGKGNSTRGDKNGDCTVATFSEPKGLDVYASTTSTNGLTNVMIIVADTANHKIKRIDVTLSISTKTWTSCKVKCLTGLCGMNSKSATDFLTPATPYSGYADGIGNETRFSAPEDVLIMNNGAYIVVADTGNFLLRWVWANGTTFTLAGKVINGLTDNEGRPLPGCQPPCMAGEAGFNDGNLTYAKFMNPTKLAKGINDLSFYVTDDHRVRLVELAFFTSTLWTINSTARVSTVAGDGTKGLDDGLATDARLFNPQGVYVTPDGIAYVVDQGSCRVRRLSPMRMITPSILYNTTGVMLIRPSGCTSWDQPFDKSGFKITRVEKNLQYNLGHPYQNDTDTGRYIKNCVGVPPKDLLQKHFLNITESAILNGLTASGTAMAAAVNSYTLRVSTSMNFTFQTGMIVSLQTGTGIPINTFVESLQYTGQYSPAKPLLTLTNQVNVASGVTVVGFGDNLVVDDQRTSINEDSEQGMAVIVYCSEVCVNLGTSVNKLMGTGGNSAGTALSPKSPVSGRLLLEGSHWYSEDSSICLAAKHDNVLPDCRGYVRATFQRYDYLKELRTSALVAGPYELGTAGSIPCKLTNGGGATTTCYFKSTDMKDTTVRVFTLERRAVSEMIVHTVAGNPSAPLSSGCGYADSQPSTLAYFNKPSGVAVKPGTSLTDTNFMYLADTNNNRIRAISATCTQICENGGLCVGPDLCKCQSGWRGEDCTIPHCTSSCGSNKVCVGPGICGCKPGYEGVNCDTAQCVQNCYNGGTCSAPDTCTCAAGWFDSNCTTPVCSNTCANGGNCTSPNQCKCPTQWTGPDCRVPVCEQNCTNGGYCVAPDTCACPPQYINYDCSVPVCTQGWFVANRDPKPFDRDYKFATGTAKKETYRPCDLQTWCNYTKEFECDQLGMAYETVAVPSGPAYRSKTGRAERPFLCMNIELRPDYITPYEIISADGATTGPRRYSPLTPYLNNPANAWRGYESPYPGLTGPWTYESDRQIANVAWYNITQGFYVCANGGNCTSPDTCQCAPGWMGFDCRTPICSQGYYNPTQQTYVSSEDDPVGKQPDELMRFIKFMQNVTNSTALHGKYYNPSYEIMFESYDGPGRVNRTIKQQGGVRYNSATGFQGGYRCSIRAVTPWENESMGSDVFSHPNYFSRYQDTKIELDGIQYTQWRNMLWPPLHHKSRVLDQSVSDVRDADFPCDPSFGSGTPQSDQCYFDPQKGEGYTDPILAARGLIRLQNLSYAYTNEGWRRRGEWNTTGIKWQAGLCIIEFRRNCSYSGATSSATEQAARLVKLYDMNLKRYGGSVMDPDVSYRPRISFNDFVVKHQGRWVEMGGECRDEVIRGCYNNGTCVGPNQCICAKGWVGSDCTTPLCSVPCQHNGNCTFPDTCTCERGWEGPDCTIPICAQDCMNGGTCVAPDTCKCAQWDNVFRDGRLNGGRPLYQDQLGFPLKTGWTGFDCATPICVQAKSFLLNMADDVSSKHRAWFYRNKNISIPDASTLEKLGGHGGDNRLSCIDPLTGKLQPRCPQYNVYVTGNEGATFQSGCGYDHYDTGCCEDDPVQLGFVICYVCPPSLRMVTNNTFFCHGEYIEKRAQASDLESLRAPFQGSPLTFLKDEANIKMCGRYHRPRYHNPNLVPEDMGIVRYYTDFLFRPLYSNRNYLNTLTSDRFLCNVDLWEQGDYVDDGGAGLSGVQQMGSIWPLERGRHIRVNFANMLPNTEKNDGTFVVGPKIPGEGVYACLNQGSCVAPDICSCTDGYDGYDCNTPLCRHLQPSGAVSSCANGGICSKRDTCDCVQVQSLLFQLYPDTPTGLTGWSGSDCTIPMCSQGYYDPFCTDLPEAPAGEGCYRCANAGNCTAPDVCTCAPGWGGFDCRTPLCHVVADPLTRTQLATVFEDKVISFEDDPCGYEALYGVRGWQGTKYPRGNCTKPNVCTCLCKDTYSAKNCKKTGKNCNGPWQDALSQYRNVLTSRTTGLGFDGSWVFGSTNCAKGYEGNVNDMDQFVSCHLTIYEPSVMERSTVQIVVGFVIAGFTIAVVYYFVAARIKQRFLLAKVRCVYCDH